jgi:hypothetical protein
MWGSDARDVRAGGTSGNVPRESYARISLAISESDKVTPDSANACLREAFVTSDIGVYSAELARSASGQHVFQVG